MSAAQRSEPSSILDFGCGYGRVLRVLRNEFPDARITACDVDRGAAEFCAQTFGATAVYSSTDPSEVRLGGKFDLIWVGAVFTHIDLSLKRCSRFSGSLTRAGLASADIGPWRGTIFQAAAMASRSWTRTECAP